MVRSRVPPRRRFGWIPWAVLFLLIGGCETPRFAPAVVRQYSGGEVRIWSDRGQLLVGENRIVAEIVREAPDPHALPPRIRFYKEDTGAGYRAEREARLRRTKPDEFEGSIELPEPGSWTGIIELGRERIPFEIEVGGEGELDPPERGMKID